MAQKGGERRVTSFGIKGKTKDEVGDEEKTSKP